METSTQWTRGRPTLCCVFVYRRTSVVWWAVNLTVRTSMDACSALVLLPMNHIATLLTQNCRPGMSSTWRHICLTRSQRFVTFYISTLDIFLYLLTLICSGPVHYISRHTLTQSVASTHGWLLRCQTIAVAWYLQLLTRIVLIGRSAILTCVCVGGGLYNAPPPFSLAVWAIP